MDVKIGVLHTPRELLVDTDQTQDEVQTAVTAAFEGKDAVLALTDRRGRRVLVPSERVAYVEIDEADTRRVGFTAND